MFNLLFKDDYFNLFLIIYLFFVLQVRDNFENVFGFILMRETVSIIKFEKYLILFF